MTTDKDRLSVRVVTPGPRRGSAEARIQRLEKALLLLASHVGATGWNKSLQELLDEIQRDLRT